MNKKEYLEIASRRKGTDTAAFDLPMPSGAVWRVLPVSIQPFILSGRLPMHLLQNLKSIKDLQNNPEALAEKMSGDDVLSMYAVVRDVMLSNVLEPKISLTPSDETLAPEEIIPEDFEFFCQWVWNGGQATSAASFRARESTAERNGTPGSSSNSSDQAASPVSDLTN